MTLEKTIRSDCPIANSLDLWGDRWSLLLIRDMMFEGKQYYGEFLQAREGISTNILADRLVRLEEAGVIVKRRDALQKRRYVYSLTPKGIDLLPVLVETAVWGLRHHEHTVLSPHIVAAIQADKQGFIRSVQQRLLAAILADS
ncbi:MAG: helix-turn-helix domain-containing protein [Chloroflexota bacterium]